LTRFVLDASVSLSWFLDDPVPNFATNIKRSLRSGSIAVVPMLWHLEMANGFAIAERRVAITSEFADRCLNDIEGLTDSVIESSSEKISFRQALAVARLYKLTAYDAVYLETARREHLGLATLDRALIQAATRAGVDVLN
jgi:predicted nucleic acid-binding protein